MKRNYQHNASRRLIRLRVNQIMRAMFGPLLARLAAALDPQVKK